jgi:hypothetical protein
MISGRAEKTSLAGSILAHAVVVLAVLALAGENVGESAGPEKRDVPESTRGKVEIPGKGQAGKVRKEKTAAVPEPQRREISKRVAEVEPVPAMESISFEAPAFHREGLPFK